MRAEQVDEAALVRVVAAGRLAASEVTVSTVSPLSAAVRAWLDGVGVRSHVEDAAAWVRRARELARLGGRIRVLGGTARQISIATDGKPTIAVYAGDVVSAGQVEMLTFLREQAVSITAHRFGTPRRYPVPPARATV